MRFIQEFFPMLKVRNAYYTRVEACEPWGFDFIPYRHTKFGIVLSGECLIDVKDGREPVRLQAGECYLLPRGDAFRLRDRNLSECVEFEKALEQLDGRVLRYGDSGAKTVIVGGRFVFEKDGYPAVLDLLPPLMHFHVSDAERAALEATLALLAKETTQPGPGSELLLDRLADIFFIQALRAYLLEEAPHEVGWTGAVGDEKLSSALRLMHRDMHLDWTLAELARQVGMSRAVFAAKFKEKIGTTPMIYLTRFRMTHAKRLLQQSTLSIAQIAAKVGYTSEAAFNKAFRRDFGLPPGTYRNAADFRNEAKMEKTPVDE